MGTSTASESESAHRTVAATPSSAPLRPPGDGAVGRYSAFIRWMVADAFWRFRGLVIGVVAAGALAVALQVKAIALTVYYTRLFEDNRTLTVLGQTHSVRQSILLLIGFGAAALLALLASAGMQYASRVWTLSLRRRYAEVCSIRVLDILQGAPHALPAGPMRFDDSTALALARSESMLCGRMVSIAVAGIAPAISFAVSLGVLFYVNWTLTLLLVGMIALCGIFLYRTNVQAANHSQRTEKLSRGAIAEYRRMVQRYKTPRGATHHGKIDGGAGVVHSDPIKSYFDAYIARLRVVADSELIGNIFLAIVLAMILVALGAAAILRGSGWETMVVYLVALRYALVTFRGEMRTITSFNRFYPQVRRYFDFLRFSESGVDKSTPPRDTPECYTLRVESPMIDGSARMIEISAGQRVALCAPIDLNRYTMPFILRCMLGDENRHLIRLILTRSAWISSNNRLPDGELAASLGYDQAMWNELTELANRASLRRKLAEQLPQGPHTVIAADVRDGVNPTLKFLLMLVGALHEPTEWIFLDGEDLETIEPAMRDELLGRLGRRIVVVLHSQTLALAGQFGETSAAVHDADEQIGLGSIEWLAAHQSEVEKVLATAVPSRRARMDDDDDDDADDL